MPDNLTRKPSGFPLTGEGWTRVPLAARLTPTPNQKQLGVNPNNPANIAKTAQRKKRGQKEGKPMWKNIPGKGIDGSMLNKLDLTNIDLSKPTSPIPMEKIIEMVAEASGREELLTDRVKGLQTYKMYEGDPYEYVRLDKVLEILGEEECRN